MTPETVIQEANRIKDRLRACGTPQEVEAVATEERAKVKAMREMGGEGETMAWQIINLKAHMLHGMEGKRK